MEISGFSVNQLCFSKAEEKNTHPAVCFSKQQLFFQKQTGSIFHPSAYVYVRDKGNFEVVVGGGGKNSNIFKSSTLKRDIDSEGTSHSRNHRHNSLQF